MLTFNGLTFARDNGEMVESLFHTGKTHSGFYKRIKGGFQLFNLQRELFAFVDPARALVVTAYMTECGARYMFSTCSKTEKALNIPDSYLATREACAAAFES